MKKYLLSLLSIPFLMVGFSNAMTLVDNGEGGYSPSQVVLDSCSLSVSNLVASDNTSDFHIVGTEDNEVDIFYICYSYEDDCSFQSEVCDDSAIGTVVDIESSSGSPFVSLAINGLSPVSQGGGESGGGESGGGESGGGESGGGGLSEGVLLPGGQEALSGVMSQYGGVIGEITNYILYIILGVLGVAIGFYAIRWLLVYIYFKIQSTFTSGSSRKRFYKKHKRMSKYDDYIDNYDFSDDNDGDIF